MRLLVLLSLLVASQATPEQLIEELLQKTDLNGNRRITREELKRVFEGFDQNDDKSITNAEFVAVWTSETGHTAALASAFFGLADLNEDGVIDDLDYPLIYDLFDQNGDNLVYASEFAAAWREIIAETPFVVLFERADSNNDGLLSKPEFVGFFATFDTDGNGNVDLQEFTEGWSHADFALLSDAVNLFGAVDSDGSGVIEAGSDIDTLFDAYDINNDGSLSLHETVEMRDMLY